MQKNKKYKKIKYQITTGIILIVVGIILLSLNYVSDMRDEVFSSMNLKLTEYSSSSGEISSSENEVDSNNVSENQDDESIENINNEEEDTSYEPYFGTIKIDKIDFYKGFYSKTSSLNNVKFNLYVMPTSSYPYEDNSNLIIAGHSGDYSNSYFRDLYKLEVGDVVVVNVNNVDYNYTIKNIYNQEKTGTINIYRNLNKKTLTLITCTKDDENHQTVYIGEID